VPSINIVREPELRTNPYTGEAMKKESAPYRENGIDLPLFKKFITN